jgi:FkbM family methyltransferase
MAVKRFVERVSGYWIYKRRHLPVGADLRVDLDRMAFMPRTIFDVGANVGQTYCRFRRDFPDASIQCFEPVSSAFEKLSRAIKNDALASASRVALGETQGFAQIHTHEEWSELSSLRSELAVSELAEVVEITTIDLLAPRRIDLLKIDTEGFEIPVLRGAHSMLERGSIGAVFCEVGFEPSNTRNTYIGYVLELLSAVGYRCYGLYDVTHYPGGTPSSFANALFLHDSLFRRQRRVT